MKRLIVLYFLVQNIIFSQNLNFIRYGANDGLPSAQVFTINQSENGLIWFGFQSGGLVSFDGKNFSLFTVNDGLTSNGFFSSAKSPNGDLYFGTTNGITIFRNNKFESLNDSSLFKGNLILCIYPKNDNEIWIGSKKGVAVYKNNKFYLDKFPQLKNKLVFEIKKNPLNDEVWFGTRKGLFIFKNGILTEFEKSKELPITLISSIDFDKSGNVYIGTYKGLVKFNIKSKKLNIFTEKDGLVHHKIEKVLVDSNKVWIGTEDGLSLYENNKFKNFTTANGLTENSVRSIFKDNSDNIWFGTDVGINKLTTRNNVLLYNQKDFIHVWSTFQLKSGEILFGTEKAGVLVFDNNRFFNLIKNKKLKNLTYWSILEDSKNNLWFGTSNGILIKSSNSKNVKYFKHNKFFEGNDVLDIYEDSKENIWISTFYDGLFRYKDGKLTQFTEKDGLSDKTVFSVIEDKLGRLWVGTGNGISLIENDKVSANLKNPLDGISINDITSDINGNIILGSMGNGIYIHKLGNPFKKENFQNITMLNGLNDDNVYFLKVDKNNNLYAGTNQGLNRINLNKFFKENEIQVNPSDKSDGILNYEVTQNSALIDKENNLWYGSINGLVRYKLSESYNVDIAPDVYIRDIFVNDQRIDSIFYDKSGSYTFSYDKNNIKFSFAAIALTHPSLVKYKYRLLNHKNENWSNLTLKSEASFFNLTPDNYTLEVVSTVDNGKTFSKPLVLNFRIKSPFWATLWFRTLLILFISSLIFIFYKIRLSNIIKEKKDLENRLNERKKYENQIKQSESSLNKIIDSTPFGVVVISKNGNIIKTNKYALEKLGYNDIAEFRSDHMNHQFLRTKMDFSKPIEEIKEEIFQDDVLITKDLKEIPIIKSSIKLVLAGEEVILVSFIDNSAEIKVKEALIKAKEEAEKADKMKTEFLAQMSHEIRTPINFILSNISLIEYEVKDKIDQELLSCFDSIKIGSKRLIRTIDLILNMSELETGMFKPNFEEIDIHDDVLINLEMEFRERLRQKNLSLEIEKLCDNCNVIADAYTISQIFVNLIDNAIKYTIKGGIKISLLSNANYVIVKVSDTGIGISKEYLPYLFTKFSQEEQGYTRRFEGNGLGLALVKKYCEINHATINVESEKNKGTTFTISFLRN